MIKKTFISVIRITYERVFLSSRDKSWEWKIGILCFSYRVMIFNPNKDFFAPQIKKKIRKYIGLA